jgi:hypothetical protein
MTALQHGGADWLCRQAASDMAILLLAVNWSRLSEQQFRVDK